MGAEFCFDTRPPTATASNITLQLLPLHRAFTLIYGISHRLMIDMTVQRNSNAQRAVWRQRCRETLANHIVSRTGLCVKPQDVRLLPNREDGYRWTSLPDKAHLFTKQLSKLSTGVYMELVRDVGINFEAVSVDPTSLEGGEDNCPTFSSRISELEHKNARWQQVYDELYRRYEAEHRSRRHAHTTCAKYKRRAGKAHTRAQYLKNVHIQLVSKLQHLERRNKSLQQQGTRAITAFQEWTQLIGSSRPKIQDTHHEPHTPSGLTGARAIGTTKRGEGRMSNRVPTN